MSFLDVYRAYSWEVVDSPLPYAEFISLATAGAAIGRKRFIQFGHLRIYPNIYLIVLGESFFTRKSTSVRISRDLMYRANIDKILPSDFTYESIIKHLNEHPVGVFYYYEFKTLSAMLEKSYMTGSKALVTELFDGNPLPRCRVAADKTFNLEGFAVSFIAATTPQWFVDSIQHGDIEGGYLNRFIYVNGKEKPRNDYWPNDADDEKWKNAVGKLSNLDSLEEYQMEVPDETKQVYKQFYERFQEKFKLLHPAYRDIFSRINVYAIKFAIILETCTTLSTTISPETMAKACQLCNFLIQSTEKLCSEEMTFSKSHSDTNKVLKIIKEKKKIPRSELMRMTHFSKRDFDNILGTLTDSETVEYINERIGDSAKTSVFVRLKEINKNP